MKQKAIFYDSSIAFIEVDKTIFSEGESQTLTF